MAISANDKARFCFTMARHTQATFAQCQRLLRLAGSLHRFDVERCNRPETEAHRVKIGRLQTQVKKLCDSITNEPPWVVPAFTWEPMACAVVLAMPDGFSDQADEPKGIGVPA